LAAVNAGIYQQPAVYHQPATYHQPAVYQQPAVYHQPAAYHQPAVYHQQPTLVKTAIAAPIVKKLVHEEAYAPAHYAFEYSVHDDHTGDIKSQHERREGDNVVGQYSLVDADGHRRVVDYTADAHNGFNAVVRREPLGHQVQKVVAAAPLPHKVIAAPIAHKVVAPAHLSYTHAQPAITSHIAAPAYTQSYAAPSLSHSYAHAPALQYGRQW
jgi:hypothetical protein